MCGRATPLALLGELPSQSLAASNALAGIVLRAEAAFRSCFHRPIYLLLPDVRELYARLIAAWLMHPLLFWLESHV